MYLAKPEKFLTLTVDPGDNTGWMLGCGPILCAAGQQSLWPFTDDVWNYINGGESELRNKAHWTDAGAKYYDLPIGRIIIEDFRIYPDKAKALSWDPLRTPRLIGALTFIARRIELPLVFQPASIKKRAEDGGAEEFFYQPLRENRHMNDAIRHWWYFVQLGPAGDPRVPNNKAEKQRDECP